MTTFANTAELRQAIRETLVSQQDELGIVIFDGLTRSGISVELHPSRTEFNPTNRTIYISNAAVSAYAAASDYKSALSGLFYHEYGHATHTDAIKQRWVDSMNANSRDVSSYAFYDNEADSIAWQFIVGTSFGMNWGGVNNAEIQAYYQASKQYFQSHDINWTALQKNLSQELSSQMRISGSDAASAEAYANAVEAAVREKSAALAGGGSFTLENNTYGGNALELPLSQLPAFETIDVYRHGNGDVTMVGNMNGQQVFSLEFRHSGGGGLGPKEDEEYNVNRVSQQLSMRATHGQRSEIDVEQLAAPLTGAVADDLKLMPKQNWSLDVPTAGFDSATWAAATLTQAMATFDLQTAYSGQFTERAHARVIDMAVVP